MTESEKAELIRLIEAGEPIPERWRARLFPGSARGTEIGKEYRLVYEGKMKREEVLATTPAAPWQLVRSFCPERPHGGDGWKNLLVWGDNAHRKSREVRLAQMLNQLQAIPEFPPARPLPKRALSLPLCWQFCWPFFQDPWRTKAKIMVMFALIA